MAFAINVLYSVQFIWKNVGDDFRERKIIRVSIVERLVNPKWIKNDHMLCCEQSKLVITLNGNVLLLILFVREKRSGSLLAFSVHVARSMKFIHAI